jgi:hypothetical protein
MPGDDLRVGRYSYARAMKELEAKLQERKRGSHKAAASALGMKPPDFSKRLNEVEGARFTVEELGLIADHFQAPPGWPCVEWMHAEELERAYRARSRK